MEVTVLCWKIHHDVCSAVVRHRANMLVLASILEKSFAHGQQWDSYRTVCTFRYHYLQRDTSKFTKMTS